ncbi:MAG: hypothetical protein WKF37_21100 [Bryobacteraceae bacterium]
MNQFCALVVLLPAALGAQEAQPPVSSAVDPAAPVEQTWSGVLMDASCPAIKPDDFASGTKNTPETRARAEAPARPTKPTGGSPPRARSPEIRWRAPNCGVREKYKDCMVTPATKTFAIHSDGRVIKLNAASNEMVSMQLAGESFKNSVKDADGKPKWSAITITGAMSEKEIKATKISK